MSSALSEQQETERAFEERKNFFDDINFDEIDEDLAAFQQDIAVQQALQRGVDLKKYAHELEKDLKQVCARLIFEYSFGLIVFIAFRPKMSQSICT